jgi:trehalose utilization protein
MLANPDTAGLGPDLIVPPKGFSFTKFGVTCENCAPTAAQTEAFIRALDTLDVAYIGCFSNLGGIITGTQRDKLLSFMSTKAYIGVNRVADTQGAWPALDSIQGVRMENHPSADRNATLRRDSVAQNDPDWKYLNQSLFQNGLDTAFIEMWFSWTRSGELIRAGNSLGSMIITVKILEETYQGGMGGAKAMGDHPMSWGRRMAGGGRVFYTAVGHRVNNYLGGPKNPRFLRRQLYNAILWTAKYDSLAQPSGVFSRRRAEGDASSSYRLEALPSMLKLTWLTGGPHTLELRGIDGRRVVRREGSGPIGAGYVFENLRPGVYALAVASGHGHTTRLVAVP